MQESFFAVRAAAASTFLSLNLDSNEVSVKKVSWQQKSEKLSSTLFFTLCIFLSLSFFLPLSVSLYLLLFHSVFFLLSVSLLFFSLSLFVSLSTCSSFFCTTRKFICCKNQSCQSVSKPGRCIFPEHCSPKFYPAFEKALVSTSFKVVLSVCSIHTVLINRTYDTISIFEK